MEKACVWLGGEWGSSDWAEALEWLHARAVCRPVQAVGELPAAVLIAQARPGDFSQEELERVRARAGDAPVFAALGPWCEGELRSGLPLAGVTRIEWRRWRSGFEVELAPLLIEKASGDRPRHRLPADAQLIARNLRAARHFQPISDAAVVYTERRPVRAWLSELLGALRIQVYNGPPAPEKTLATGGLVFYDGWPQVERHWQANECIRPIRELLLLDWPRPADAERARDAGLYGIVALPLVLVDFVALITAS